MPKNSTKTELDGFNETNGAILAEILAAPDTSEAVRLQIINELNEVSKSDDFFETVFLEQMSLGECPCCGHKNHWAIPEERLAQYDYVSHLNDPRVKMNTTREDCPEFQESCSKKKVTA